MSLQSALAIAGIVILAVIYVISRTMEKKELKKKESQGKNLMQGIFGRTENEPNFGRPADEDDDRGVSDGETSGLTGATQTGSIPVLPVERIVGQYQDQPYGNADDDAAYGPADAGDQPTAAEAPESPLSQRHSPEPRLPTMSVGNGPAGEVQDADNVGADADLNMADSGQNDVSTASSRAPEDQSPDKYEYPEIDGFSRVSQIDYWIKLTDKQDAGRGVGRESVLALYRELAGLIGKRHKLFGQKIPKKAWCVLEEEAEDARFGDLLLTLQLVDQSGAASSEDLDRFVNLAKGLAKSIGYDFSLMAPVESALQQSRAIADFVRHYGSWVTMIQIKPLGMEYFDGAAISRCANQFSLERSPEGFFVRGQLINKKKIHLYHIANKTETGQFDFDNMKDTQVRGVIFFTNPVFNRSPGVVFAEMADTAKAFAARIKGEAIVPNYHGLPQAYIDQNRSSLERIAREMEELGIASGSEEAMRLF